MTTTTAPAPETTTTNPLALDLTNPDGTPAGQVTVTGFTDAGDYDEFIFTLPGNQSLTVRDSEHSTDCRVNGAHGVAEWRWSVDDALEDADLTDAQREVITDWITDPDEDTETDVLDVVRGRYYAARSKLGVHNAEAAAEALAVNDRMGKGTALTLLETVAALLAAYADATGRHPWADLGLWGDLDARPEDERTPEYPTAYLAMLAVIERGLPAPGVFGGDDRSAVHFAQAEADAAAEFMEAHGFVKPLQYPGDDDDVVTCDGCPATSETGWGDAPTCLACTPPENVCTEHQRTHDGTCHLCPTWTIFGHWEDGRLVADDWELGEADDDREDDGTHDEGLWSASGPGATWEAAFADLRAEYEGADTEGTDA